MNEFDAITDLGQAAKWLDVNAPNFRQVTEQVYEKFKQELIAERNNILGMA